MFTNQQLVLQLGYVPLFVAALASRRSTVRLCLALTACVGLTVAIGWERDLVTAGWMLLILIASLTLLVAERVRNRRARFTAEEEAMRAALLADVPVAEARHLIDQGFWLSGVRGDVLTREGRPVQHVIYLATGSAVAMSGGQQVGRVQAGELVGEATILTGAAATATVVLDAPARFWCGPAQQLRTYLAENPDLRSAIQTRFSAALTEKLLAANRTLAVVGTGAHRPASMVAEEGLEPPTPGL